MPQDVAHLVTAARGGDREAFDELVRATYAETFTLALRLTGNEEDARTWCRRPTSEPSGASVASAATRSSPRGCTGSPPTARTRSWPSAGKHRHDVLDDTDPIADDRPQRPQLQADATAAAPRLTEALEDLPPKLRQVVVLRDIYDLPHEAIAAELGSPRPPPRCASTGHARSCGRTCSPAVSRRPPMRCEERRRPGGRRRRVGPHWAHRTSPRRAVLALPGRDGAVPQGPRALRAMRTEVLEPAPGLLSDILANLEAAGERRAIRSMIQGHQPRLHRRHRRRHGRRRRRRRHLRQRRKLKPAS